MNSRLLSSIFDDMLSVLLVLASEKELLGGLNNIRVISFLSCGQQIVESTLTCSKSSTTVQQIDRDGFYGRPMQYGRPLYFCPVVSSSIFYLSIFFPRLFSAVGDWMSTILPHIVCLSANLGCRSESCCTWLAENTGRKKSPKIRQPVGQRVERTATVRSTGCKPGRTTGLTSGLTTGCIHDTVGCQTGLPTCLTTG